MSKHNDNFNELAPVPIYGPILVAATVSFTSTLKVDTQNFESATMHVQIGTQGDTHDGSNNIYFEMWESDAAASGFTKVDADDVITTDATPVNKFGLFNATADINKIASLGYKGAKRYLELRGVVTGTLTNGAYLAAWVTNGHPRLASTNVNVQSS